MTGILKSTVLGRIWGERGITLGMAENKTQHTNFSNHHLCIVLTSLSVFTSLGASWLMGREQLFPPLYCFPTCRLQRLNFKTSPQ